MAPMSTQTAPPTTATTAGKNFTTSTNAPIPNNADTSIPDAPPTPNTPNAKKRKRKDKPTEKQTHILHQTTFRKTSWSYFHLMLLTPGTASLPPTTTTTTTTTTSPSPSTSTPTPSPSISPLLTSTLLTAPLRAYLGTTGTAIPIDTLKIHGREVWVRIPRQDARGFRASLSGWVGSCEGDEVPGVEQGVGQGQGRVGVAWRVVGEGGVLGCLGGSGDGMGDGGDLFG